MLVHRKIDKQLVDDDDDDDDTCGDDVRKFPPS